MKKLNVFPTSIFEDLLLWRTELLLRSIIGPSMPEDRLASFHRCFLKWERWWWTIVLDRTEERRRRPSAGGAQDCIWPQLFSLSVCIAGNNKQKQLERRKENLTYVYPMFDWSEENRISGNSCRRRSTWPIKKEKIRIFLEASRALLACFHWLLLFVLMTSSLKNQMNKSPFCPFFLNCFLIFEDRYDDWGHK